MPRTRKAQKLRTSKEFDFARLLTSITPPRSSPSDYAWSAEAITAAKNAQARGDFAIPSRMIKKMREDDAIFTAWQVRLSPEAAIEIDLEPAASPRGRMICAEGEALFGEQGVGLRPETRQDILSDLVDHGVAFAVCEHKAREDGSRIDIEVRHWPIEHVRWDDTKRSYVTRVDGDMRELTITHGDGTWIVFAKSHTQPWAKHAAILPGALVWSTHAWAVRDWASASYSNGNAKVVGELPAEFAWTDNDGNLTSQASAFFDIVKAAATSEQLAAIIPAGAKASYLANPSTAHAIWVDIVNNRERAAQRVWCGTDASLGSPGGAPGVDILTLFGVSNTLGETDLRALERGFQAGAIDVWCAVNFGDSSLAPRWRYLIPNADAQAEREAYAVRIDVALRDLERLRALGFALSPELVAEVAARYDVSLPAPPVAQAAPVPITLAPTDIVRIVRTREARASQGLGPLGDERDDLMVSELEAAAAAKRDAEAAALQSATAPAPDTTAAD